MAVTIKQTESEPADWPATPSGLSPAAAALDPAVVWTRIETYIRLRWSERAVVWIVEGPGQWEAPLSPATVSTIEIWRNGVWSALVPPAAPIGGFLLNCEGPYRFTGTVGGDEVPPSGKEAFRRLAEYMAAKPGKPGAVSESVSAGSVSLSSRRSASWLADAMVNSGAADLLRTYRRAA
jgi:hypothetical protein